MYLCPKFFESNSNPAGRVCINHFYLVVDINNFSNNGGLNVLSRVRGLILSSFEKHPACERESAAADKDDNDDDDDDYDRGGRPGPA